MDLFDYFVIFYNNIPQHVVEGNTSFYLELLTTLVYHCEYFGNKLLLSIEVAFENRFAIPEDITLLIVIWLLKEDETTLDLGEAVFYSEALNFVFGEGLLLVHFLLH